MTHRCTHYAGRCDRLVCDKEEQRPVRRCNFAGCDRARFPGSTMCGRHRSAGRSTAQERMTERKGSK